MVSVYVITATTGHALLDNAIRSVHRQKLSDDVTTKHVLVVDGQEYKDSVDAIVDALPAEIRRNIVLLYLPENTGREFICHRIYASVPMLVTCDYVSFLDEDNEYEQTHIQSLLDTLKKRKSRWSYSLRKIYDGDDFVSNDSCESLGNIHHTCLSPDDRLIDTNTFLFDRELALQLGPIWYGRHKTASHTDKKAADRNVTNVLLQNEPDGTCTRQYTLKYRTSSRGDASVSKEFFSMHGPVFDPEKKDVYLFFKDEDTTRSVLKDANLLVSKLRETYNVFNGFDNIKGLPSDAKILSVITEPLQYLETLSILKSKNRKHMHRVVLMTRDFDPKIDIPGNFCPVYADIAVPMNALDVDMPVPSQDLVFETYVRDTVDDEHLKKLKTTDDQRAVYHVCNQDDIQRVLAEGHVALSKVTNMDALPEDVKKRMDFDWIDLSRVDVWGESNDMGREEDWHVKYEEFMKANYYNTKDIMTIIKKRNMDAVVNAFETILSNLE